MTEVFAGTAFGQVLSLPLQVRKQKQKLTKYGIMKKERITSLIMDKSSQQRFFYSSQKNIYEGLYESQVQTTVFTNKYASSKIIGAHCYVDSVVAALNDGSIILVEPDQENDRYVSQEILKGKFQPTLNKCFNKIVFDQHNSFCLVGKEVIPFLYDSEKSLITWNGKNVSNDDLDLRVPVNDVDATFFKGGKQLACAHANNKVRVYDVRTNKQKPSADYHLKLDLVYNKTFLTKIVVNPYNQNLFYIGNDLGAIYQCDLRRSMQVVGKFKSINSTVTDIKILKDNMLAASSLDCYVRTFDLESKQLKDKFYMNKPIYSMGLKQREQDEVKDYGQEVLSQAQEQELNPVQPQSKKMKKLRKRNKVNLKYLKPVNWDQVPIKEQLLQQAKQQYEQINEKDADNYEQQNQLKIKDEHDSDEGKDSDLD